jgi:hypothetical protein
MTQIPSKTIVSQKISLNSTPYFFQENKRPHLFYPLHI